MNTSAKISRLLLVTFSLLLARPAFSQGDLTPPPGPPAPTMKTLTQVEPRIPIDSLPFTISQSGSYYFTKDLDFTAASGNAISVNALDVTIDLMGFILSSSSGVTGNGIDVGANVRCTVKNGTIRGTTSVTITGTFPNRTWTATPGGFNHGVAAGTAGSCRFLDLTLTRCRSNGLEGNANSLAERCAARGNGSIGIQSGTVTNSTGSNNAAHGISADDGTVTGCTASNNGSDGIRANEGTVTGCTASNNGSAGIEVSNGTVTGCTVSKNDNFGIREAQTVTNCLALGNGGIGIHSFGAVMNCNANGNLGIGISGESVTKCQAHSNGKHGISVLSLAQGNESSNNGTGADGGAGISFVGFVTGSNMRIEDNNCTGNTWGILGLPGAHSFIVRNSCRGSSGTPGNPGASANYDFDRSTNTYGPVITVIGDMSANPATSHPGANIQY